MKTTALKTASEHTGPIILGAGVAMMAVAVFTSGHDGGSAQAAPMPAVTVTGPPRVVTAAPSQPSPSPRSSPSSRATLVADHAPPAAGAESPQERAGGMTGRALSPSTPAPSAATSPRCSDRVLAVQIPLGVLGNCAITVGGSR